MPTVTFIIDGERHTVAFEHGNDVLHIGLDAVDVDLPFQTPAVERETRGLRAFVQVLVGVLVVFMVFVV